MGASINLYSGKPANCSGPPPPSGFGKEVKKQRYKYNIWYFQKENKGSRHPASFPEKLANDHIMSWSNEVDLVYDPFMGSGTTAKMALKNNRNYIGSEISQEYCEIAKNRIQGA